MGSVCCVAARDKINTNGNGTDILHRNIRHSPSWSFRWDNRGRVAGEETSITWFSDGMTRNDESNTKHEPPYASDEGSPLQGFPRTMWQKSPVSEGTSVARVRNSVSDQSISRNISLDLGLEKVKEMTGSPGASYPSPTKSSLSLPSTSSLSASPLSSQSHLQPTTDSTTTKLPRHSPRHPLMQQVSVDRIPKLKTSNGSSVREEKPPIPSWSFESNGGSHGGSSDSWSMHAFSELMATSHRERWSFDNESLGFNRDKMTRATSQISAASSVDIQICGLCSKLLTEYCIVAVLTCSHVYHAECLENVTPEINKYDPNCPVCTLGEKKTLKLSEKAVKASMESKAKSNKRSRKRIVDSNYYGESVVSDHFIGSGHGGKCLKIGSSSSLKGSLGNFGKPFMRRHFTFGSKGSRSTPEHQSSGKRGLFWVKSSKS